MFTFETSGSALKNPLRNSGFLSLYSFSNFVKPCSISSCRTGQFAGEVERCRLWIVLRRSSRVAVFPLPLRAVSLWVAGADVAGRLRFPLSVFDTQAPASEATFNAQPVMTECSLLNTHGELTAWDSMVIRDCERRIGYRGSGKDNLGHAQWVKKVFTHSVIFSWEFCYVKISVLIGS